MTNEFIEGILTGLFIACVFGIAAVVVHWVAALEARHALPPAEPPDDDLHH